MENMVKIDESEKDCVKARKKKFNVGDGGDGIAEG